MSADPTPGADDYLAYAQSGEAAALERALRACADRAYAQAHRHLGNPADADDAVQEAFLQLARTAHRFDGSVPFAAWVGRLVQVACLRLRRSDRRRRRREEEAMAMQPRPVPANPDAETVRALVTRLSAADQAVIDLHYFAGLSQAEVAAALGTSENAVALRLSRARNRLRTLLGGSATAASVALLLAAQPAPAASPAVLASIGALSTTIAAGGALPATTIPLSLSQKGLWLMSSHPLAAALCAGLLLLAGLLPAMLWSADPPPPPAPKPVPVTAADQPWQGKARELLPFIDPDAPVQAALDWEFLRRHAATTKPTSLLADPRAQAALAHIREQSRLYATITPMPDLAALLGGADGAAFSARMQPARRFSLVTELGDKGARDLQEVWDFMAKRYEKTAPQRMPPARSGSFTGYADLEYDAIVAQAGSQWAYANPQALQDGFTRPSAPPPPAAAWARIGLGEALAALATMDKPGEDPLGLAAWFGPTWRTAQPQLDLRIEAQDGLWRATTRLQGLADLPLRPAAPAIAGCVPAGALASLVVGTDPARCAELLGRYLSDQDRQQATRQLAALGLPAERLAEWLSGDLAVVAQPQAPFPVVSVVLGLQPGAAAAMQTALAKPLAHVSLVPTPAAPPALAMWSGATPLGMLSIALAPDRLVLSTGDVTACLTAQPRPVADGLVVEIDLPTLARSFLPMLYGMIPAQPQIITQDNPLRWWAWHLSHCTTEWAARSAHGQQPPPPIDLDSRSMPEDFILPVFRNQSMQPRVAVLLRPGQQREYRIVVRTAADWRIITDPPLSVERCATAAELERRLAGLVLAAGSPPAGLLPIEFPEQPTFDRRWLPPPAVIAEHLPHYRLRIRGDQAGLQMVEDGLPLLTLTTHITAAAPQIEPQLLGLLRGEAAFQLWGASAQSKHQRALAALQHASVASHTLRDHPPFLRPSELLLATKIPFAELASLTNGQEPTAAQIDALGIWQPISANFLVWIIPVEDGRLYIDMTTHRTALVGYPQYMPKPLSPAEQAALLQKWQMEQEDTKKLRRNRQPPPEPLPAEKPSDF